MFHAGRTEWEDALVAYAAAHPEVCIFDPPAATYPLRNRCTMVAFLEGGGWLFEVRSLAAWCLAGLVPG
jgi:hypothetical protein